MIVKKEKPAVPFSEKKPSTKPGAVKASGTGVGLKLPDGPSEPVTQIGECNWLIYGEKKIGKTSLASEFPDALFLMFEPGGKGLRIAQMEMKDWDTFTRTIDLLAKDSRYSTVIIDTVDFAYDRCFEHMCEVKGVDHPNEKGFGEVWNAIESEFTRQMNRLILDKRGVIFTSHADTKEFQTRSGMKYDKLVPTMGKQARAYIAGIADITAYYGFYNGKRYLTISGSENLEAGHRLEERFRTPGGKRIHSVPMGNSKQEGYRNLIKAFNNEQAEVGNPETQAGLSEITVKRTARK